MFNKNINNKKLTIILTKKFNKNIEKNINSHKNNKFINS